MPVVHDVQGSSSSLGTRTSAATPTPSQRQMTTLPIGVIAGSLAGGVALAIGIVLAWTYWGKSLQWQRRKQAVCALLISLIRPNTNSANVNYQCTVFTTRDNIRRRASYRPQRKKPFSVRTPEKLHFERKTSADVSNEKTDAYSGKPKVPDAIEPSSPALSTTPLVPSRPTKLSPSLRLLRKHKRRTQNTDKKPTLSSLMDVCTGVWDLAVDRPLLDSPTLSPLPTTTHKLSTVGSSLLGPPILSPLPTIIHKPSTIGSSSVYSTQSGEERQFGIYSSTVSEDPGLPYLYSPIARPPLAISHKPSNISSVYSNQSGEERMFGVPPNFLVALGHDRTRFSTWTRSSGSMCSIVDEHSPPSAWVRPRARNTGGASEQQLSRLSQASNSSIFLRPNQTVVGVAYGGENEVAEVEKKIEPDGVL